MLLKKQTVWLLTMLSLVVVLSVYYIISPEQRGTEFASIEEQEESKKEGKDKKEEVMDEEMQVGEDAEDSVISSLADDELFTALRLQQLDLRSKQNEELTKLVAQTNISAEERNKALEEIKKIREIAEKEYLLETLIKTLDYEDVLVRADDEEVRVTVKADKLSRAEANEILQLVMKELGEDQLYTVEFQPKK